LPASLNALIEAGYEPHDDALVEERRVLEATLQNSEDEKYILAALATLSKPEQDLIALRYFDGLKTRGLRIY